MSREFVIANYGPDDDGIYVLIGSQGPKSTPSNGFHYGIIKYDTGTLRSKLFIPPDVNWHKNEFQEFYNVEEYLTRILKHVVKKVVFLICVWDFVWIPLPLLQEVSQIMFAQSTKRSWRNVSMVSHHISWVTLMLPKVQYP